MKARFSSVLLLLIAVIFSLIFVVGDGESNLRIAAATAPGATPDGSSTANATAPNAAWSAPIAVSSLTDYDNLAAIAVSPLNGSASVQWGSSDGTTGSVRMAANQSLGGPFGDAITLNSAGPSEVERMGIAHDSAGRRHGLYWKYTGTTLCDYYVLTDPAGNVIVNEAIPGTCNVNTPRKLGDIAVDAGLTAHILLSRNNEAGSTLYYERNNAGQWIVIAEPVPTSCAPGDIALTVSTQGVVMAAWKGCPLSGTGTDIYANVRVAPNNWTIEDMSATCCTSCPNVSNAYLPDLAADPSGGIRMVWADGRCGPNDTDIYYREWVPGTGWNNQPIVRVVADSGLSYNPTISVDGAGEAHLFWHDDTSSPVSRIFYTHGRGTVFTAPELPFEPWFAGSLSKEPDSDYAANAVHVVFGSNRDDPQKNNYYTYSVAGPPPPPSPCPGVRFKDVCAGSTFYAYVEHLAAANIVSGYNTAPPCNSAAWVPCYLPNNTIKRGQVSKLIALGANLPNNVAGGPHFTDVPVGSTFYNYVETLYNSGIVGGYTSGCATGNPCFKPNNNVTRGQVSKMASLAFGFTESVAGQLFQDVAPGNTYYAFVQRLNNRGIIGGYACGGPGEPCVAPTNRPYFRPNSNVTRGQIAKIVDLCRVQ
ncbi:MAG: S-layer homology domain-containing protein [Chloroflexota bacterium]